MSFVVLFGISAPLAGYGFRTAALGARDLSRELALGRRPTTPIREGQTGLLLLRGRARRAEGLLEAPITGRPCLAYAMQPRSGLGLRQSVPFVLEDDGGTARVESTRAALLAPDLQFENDDRERILSPGDEVFVLGQAALEPDPGGAGGSYREPPLRLHLRESRRYGLLIAYEDRPPMRRQAAWNLVKGSGALGLALASLMIVI